MTVDRPNADVSAAAPAESEATQEADATEEAAALDAKAVDEKLEQAAEKTETNGELAVPAVEATAEAEEPAKPEPAEEPAQKTEEPKEPEHTPVEKTDPQVESAPSEPAAPPKPMTWASRAAAAAGPRPVVPLPKTATPPATKESRPPAQPAAPAQAAAPPAQTTETPASTENATSKDNSGWQTAGADSKRQNRPQSASAAPEKEGTLGYVKYVTEKVQEADLRKALEAHGELAYFDINREKVSYRAPRMTQARIERPRTTILTAVQNCAFVEYKTTEGYNTALSSNPHVVNGEQIIVEQRRPKSTAYGGSSYGGRGGSQRGRGGFNGNRNGGQGGRGNFSGPSRGRGNPRGRGGAQAANA